MSILREEQVKTMSSITNLIKMEMARLVRSKTAYITLLFVAIFAALLFAMSASFGEQSQNNTLEKDNAMYAEISDEQAMEIKSSGVGKIKSSGVGFVAVDFTRNMDITFERLIHSFLSSGVFLVFCGIFAANTVCNKYKSGFQKNLGIYSHKKWQMVAAENASLLFFVAVEMILVILILLFLSVCYFDRFRLGSAVSIIRYLGMQILLYDVFSVLIMCLAELIRGKVIAITVTCLLSMGIGNVVLSKIDDLLKLKNFSVLDHCLIYHVKMLPVTYNAKVWGTAGAVAIFFFLLYNGISIAAVSQRDMA